VVVQLWRVEARFFLEFGRQEFSLEQEKSLRNNTRNFYALSPTHLENFCEVSAAKQCWLLNC
jgi:hypothetical protein